MAKMTSTTFAEKAKNIAKNYKTIYVKGCFGAPLRPEYKTRYCNAVSESRRSKIMAATPDTFGFDCVCLVKGILWGWNGNPTHCFAARPTRRAACQTSAPKRSSACAQT